MARLTFLRKAGRLVSGVCGRLKVTAMTCGTLGRCPCKFPWHLVNVTGAAIGNSMGADQRETLLGMLFEHLTLALPVVGRMTCLAFSSKLTTMGIRMAFGARRLRTGKLEILVTGRTLCLAVSAHQGEASLAMRESQWIPHLGP
jgi:hypothetical protein